MRATRSVRSPAHAASWSRILAPPGACLGFAADRFPSPDRFLLHHDNLVKQRLGVAASRHLRAEVVALDEGEVFVVRCAGSPEPVYLKQGNQERFYVRVGPSSRQLSLSEAVARLRGD